MKIILGTASPLYFGQPSPRFSLRMSAQLMFGIIKIYKRQLVYVYDDICHLVSRLPAQKLLYKVTTNIDLKIESKGDAVTMKNPLEHPEEVHPQFGHMEHVLEASLAMQEYSQSHYFNIPSSPDREQVSDVPAEMPSVVHWQDFTVAHESEITIRDELDMRNAHVVQNNEVSTIDAPLMDEFMNFQADEPFPEAEEPSLFPMHEIPQITVTAPVEEMAIDKGDVTPSVMPEAETSAIPLKKHSKRQRNGDETFIESEVPAKIHRRRSPLASLELFSLRSPEYIRRTRPHKLIIDKETQLSKNTVWKNIENSHMLCYDHPNFPNPGFETANSLLTKPISGPALNDSLIRMYKMKLVQHTEPNDNEDPYRLLFPEEYSSNETSDKNSESLSPEEEREQFRPALEETNLEIPSTSFPEHEMLADKSKSVDAASSPKSLLFPIIEESPVIELPHPDSLQQANLEAESVPHVSELLPLPEDTIYERSVEFSPKSGSSEDWMKSYEVLNDKVLRQLTGVDVVLSFQDLFPPTVINRKKVSMLFMRLLHLHKNKIVYLRQNSAYGPILISQGQQFPNV